jgi:hypothetical protein
VGCASHKTPTRAGERAGLTNRPDVGTETPGRTGSELLHDVVKIQSRRLGGRERIVPCARSSQTVAHDPRCGQPPTGQEAKALKRRKEIYLTLHPETKPVRERGGPGRGKKKTNANPASVSFTEDTAAKTGHSQRSVQEDVAIGEAVTDEADYPKNRTHHVHGDARKRLGTMFDTCWRSGPESRATRWARKTPASGWTSKGSSPLVGVKLLKTGWSAHQNQPAGKSVPRGHDARGHSTKEIRHASPLLFTPARHSALATPKS